MNKLSDLSPRLLWHYFEEICHVPRPSGKEEQIRSFLIQFADKHKLTHKTDKVGNIIIEKAAYHGFEDAKGIILQSHMDMVCEKNASGKHNFYTDPIAVYIDKDKVKAKDTTLGADNGIGMAAQLAVLASNNIPHGPLECLFTCDEESGLTGAFGLQTDFLKGKILLNLDSEEEGELFIGCAGGMDTVATFDYWMEKAPENYFFFMVEIRGLKGGHSGDDINKGRANAIKLLARYIQRLSALFDTRIVSIEGGNLHNAIPREAKAVLGVPMSEKETVRIELNHFIYDIETEFLSFEPKINCGLESTHTRPFVVNKKTADALVTTLNECPHGVISMSKNIKDLVETSTNLASVKMNERRIIIATSQRSSDEKQKKEIAQAVKNIFGKFEAQVNHSDGYPGWYPNINSPVTQKAALLYEKLFKVSPKIKAIHAGLECGLFLEKYPELDMVSFGPTITGAHSPDEQVDILSVERFWLFLTKLLLEIAENE